MRLTDAQRRLVEENYDLVCKVGSHHLTGHIPGQSRFDRLNSGVLGLIRAATRWTPECGHEFRACAASDIRFAGLEEGRTWKTRRRQFQDVDDEGDFEILGGTYTDTSVEARDLWRWVEDHLTPLRAQAIRLHCEGFRFKEIAARVGTTENAAKRRYHAGLRALRSAIDREPKRWGVAV